MANCILIAEDDENVLPLLKKVFSGAGYQVCAARTAAEALELAGTLEPDCFLLDYHLADGGTAESVCRYVRGHERLRKRPIIMWTGDHNKVDRSFEICRVDAFVPKGVRINILLATVRHHIRGAQLLSALRDQPDLKLDPGTSTVISANNAPVILPQEQFRFLSLLVKYSPRFIDNDLICDFVLRRRPQDLDATIRCLAARLRGNLGVRLARRIRCRRGEGWAYIPSRPKKTAAPATAPAAIPACKHADFTSLPPA